MIAAITWHTAGYTVALDDRRAEFGPEQIPELLAAVRGAEVVVIDSTSGVLERHLVEAGLPLHRVDPWHVPARGGSPDPDALLAAARTRVLDRVAPGDSGLHGREAEFAQAQRDCADIERELIDQGRLLHRSVSAAPRVSVTFDDGPTPPSTPEVLDILRDFDVPATFFCIGLNAAAHPRLVERIAAEGHTLANHTWSHPYLPDLPRAEVEEQVARTNATLADITGRAPTLVRPPYGGRNPDVLRWLADFGMTTVLWDSEGSDWARPGAARIEEDIVGTAGGGSVILLHDGGGDRSQTVEALPRILTRLHARGLRFVPLEDLR